MGPRGRVKSEKVKVSRARAASSGNGRLARGASKRVWIFDFDNTIARLEPEVDWAGSRRELEPMLRAAGIPDDLFEKHPRGNILLYDDTRARLLDLSRDSRSRASMTLRGVRAIIRRASKIIEQHELAGVDRAAPLDGAIELMRALKRRGAKVAIVTSNSSRTIRRWLRVHKLGGIVDAIVGRDSYLALKPSAEMIHRVLEQFGARPANAAFVGDADSDFLAAKAARVQFFGIASNPASRERLTNIKAPRVFLSPRELAMHLKLAGAQPPAVQIKADSDDAARAR